MLIWIPQFFFSLLRRRFCCFFLKSNDPEIQCGVVIAMDMNKDRVIRASSYAAQMTMLPMSMSVTRFSNIYNFLAFPTKYHVNQIFSLTVDLSLNVVYMSISYGEYFCLYHDLAYCTIPNTFRTSISILIHRLIITYPVCNCWYPVCKRLLVVLQIFHANILCKVPKCFPVISCMFGKIFE